MTTRRPSLFALAPRIVTPIVAVLALTAAAVAPAAAAETRALLLLDRLSVAQTRELAAALSADGARVEHVVPGRALIARFDDAALGATAARRGVLAVYGAGDAPADVPAADPLLSGVIAAWKAISTPETDPASSGPTPVGPPLAGDAAAPPLDVDARQKSFAAPPGAQFIDTSEFMNGSTTLTVLFPESDGSLDANQEDWTAAEEANVTAEIMNGMAWWVARGADIGHTLTFFYDFRYAIAQPYEPITRHSNDHPLWAGATMTALGYATYGNNFDNVRDLNNDARDTFGTDWAVSVFVIDDTIDPDDHFTGGYFAFSYYGGPYYWTTYGNAGWGISNYDMIAAHELGHSFYALDEYASSGCSCVGAQGYLLTQNQNCDAGCLVNIPSCIMRSSIAPISANTLESFSARQVGLFDTDGDSIPNILDRDPETTLTPFGTDTTTDFTPTYAGSGAAVARPNQNSAGPRHNITLNVVSLVECRVDGGPWTPTTPGDGSFDDSLETFTFTANPLPSGLHVFEFRAVHSYGNRDTTPATDTLFIAGSPVEVAPVDAPNFAPLSASPSPSTGRLTLRFGLAAAGPVTLAAYSVDGRRAADLLRDAPRPAGRHEVVWDGQTSSGRRAPAGVYVLRLSARDREESVRAVLLSP
jgi:hypothetical protein